MKLKALFAGLLLVCGQAFATTYTWTDTVNPTPDKLITPVTPYSFTFDIRDDGFRPFTDTVTDYSVRFNLYDDQDFFLFPLEIALINLPGIVGSNFYIDLSGTEYGGESIFGFLQLNLFGELSVSVQSTFGDFYFGDASLTANGVPEPGSLVLLGAALAGITLVSRRKQQK